MEDENWQSDELKELNLRLENQSLETELSLKDGLSFKTSDIDPRIENAFLKNVISFEEIDKEPPVTMRSLFPTDYEFPSVSSLSSEQLAKKILEIEEILSFHNIAFGFSNNLPNEVLYKYLTEDCIPNEAISATVNAGFTWTLDGCDGWCEDCFQKLYCSTAKEILETNDDELSKT